jgi:hypothetical protein
MTSGGFSEGNKSDKAKTSSLNQGTGFILFGKGMFS